MTGEVLKTTSLVESLRWRRIVFIAALGALVASGFLALPIARTQLEGQRAAEALQPKPRLASDEDWRRILTVLIDTNEFEGIPPPPPKPGEKVLAKVQRKIVLLASSIALCEDEDPVIAHSAECPGGRGSGLGITSAYVDFRIPLKLRRELVLANESSTLLAVPDSPLFLVRPAQEVDAIFANGGGWDGFYAKYPDTAGVMATSRPVVSENGDRALIVVESHCDGLCGSGGLYLLERTQSGWKIVLRHQLWFS